MGHWNYTNIGASAEPENKKHVEKIFEYIGYNPDPAYSPDGDECSFSYPDIYCCEYSDYEPSSGEIKELFRNMVYDDLLHILNAVFPKTDLYIHHAEGNNTDDTWENHDIIYDTNDMTCYYDDSYTSYDCGPNGKKSSKERFALKAPKLEYVKTLIDLSAADDNGELTALLLDLSRKLKDGLIVYKDDESDKRIIGEKYDVINNVTGDEEDTEEEDFLRYINKIPYQRFITMYKINPTSLDEDCYEEFLRDAISDYYPDIPFDIDYEDFVDRVIDSYECESKLDQESYEEVRKEVVQMLEDDE